MNADDTTATDMSGRVEQLRQRAIEVRLRDLKMVHRAKLGHIGGEFSAIDILVTLFFGGVLRYDPTNPDDPERDRFVLSKGHSAAALYTTLAKAGYFDEAELDTFLQPLSRLNGHPDRNKVPGVETNTGPLGHGFPVAVGIALSGALDGADRRTFVLTGDGELQEGSMWEAAMAAGHYELDRLVCIVDRNRLQQGDRTETTMGLDPLPDKFEAFGWAVREVDGNDPAALLEVFAGLPFETGRPNCIIANTTKGKGVSFIEDRKEWHHRIPTDEEYTQAVAELEGGRA
ncbi:MAG: transketolase [Candidatus Limnocylindrales bacterium]